MTLTKRDFKNLVVSLTAILIAIAVIIVIIGGPTGSLEKVRFSDAHPLYIRGNMDIIFHEAITVSPGNFADLQVDLDHVAVKIDPSLPGTAISASPTLLQRGTDVYIYYQAQSVTVWVQNQEEQETWKNFLQAARDSEAVRENTKIPYQKVLP